MTIKQYYTAILAALLFVTTAKAETVFRLNSGGILPLSDAEGQGFYNKLSVEIFRRLNIRHEYISLPSARSLINANQGVDDGNIARIQGMEKKWKNLIRVPESVIEWEFTAYGRDNFQLTVDGWQSIKPYAVGIVRGWQIYEKNLKDARQLRRVRNAEQLFTLLKTGRVDIAMFEKWQGEYWFKKMNYYPQQLEPKIVTKKLYIYVHKKHHGLVPRMAKVIKEMKRDGTYARIFNATLR